MLLPTALLHQLPPGTWLDHPWFSDLDHCHVCATKDRVLAHDFAAAWDLESRAAFLVHLSADGALPGRNPWRATPRTKGGTLYRVQPPGPLPPTPTTSRAPVPWTRSRVVEPPPLRPEHASVTRVEGGGGGRADASLASAINADALPHTRRCRPQNDHRALS